MQQVDDKSTNQTETDRHQSLEENTMVFEAVVKLLVERLECPASDITMDSTFHDLGIGSLDTVDLLMNLEDKLGISIELDEKVETVGDLVRFIEKN